MALGQDKAHKLAKPVHESSRQRWRKQLLITPGLSQDISNRETQRSRRWPRALLGASVCTKALLISSLGMEVASTVPEAGLTIVLLCGQPQRAEMPCCPKGAPSGRSLQRKMGLGGPGSCLIANIYKEIKSGFFRITSGRDQCDCTC